MPLGEVDAVHLVGSQSDVVSFEHSLIQPGGSRGHMLRAHRLCASGEDLNVTKQIGCSGCTCKSESTETTQCRFYLMVPSTGSPSWASAADKEC